MSARRVFKDRDACVVYVGGVPQKEGFSILPLPVGGRSPHAAVVADLSRREILAFSMPSSHVAVVPHRAGSVPNASC